MSRTFPFLPFLGTVLALVIAISITSLIAVVSAKEDSSASPAAESPVADQKVPEPIPDNATLRKMKVKQLKQFLDRKGPKAACLACTSKGEYIDRIRETADWPDVTPEPTDDEPTLEELQKMFSQGQDSEEIRKIKENLKAAGIDASNIFSANGLNKEKMEEQFKRYKPASSGEQASAGEDSHPDL